MNELISMLSLVKQCLIIIQPHNRQPVSSSSLQTIKNMFAMAINLLGTKSTNTTLLANAVTIEELIKGLIANHMTETDALAKNTLAENLQSFYDDALVESAKFYSTNKFEYNPNLDPILQDMVKAGLAAGLSFKEETNNV